MTISEIYIKRFSAWAPGIENHPEWDEWAHDKRDILSEAASPKINYTDSNFRRRLSQISKMTIQVIHDLLPFNDETKLLFFSFRGELSREYQIFKMLTEEGAISPSAFSLSGFNTPVALASIAFGLKGGYSALYPANNSFSSCIKAAQASLLSGKTDELVLIYADEKIPAESLSFFNEEYSPLAFALLLSREYQNQFTPISLLNTEDNPAAFLKKLLLRHGKASINSANIFQE